MIEKDPCHRIVTGRIADSHHSKVNDAAKMAVLSQKVPRRNISMKPYGWYLFSSISRVKLQ